ncbi:hypothetical protein BSFA1_17710 [Burkholderia sp. SFA1]|nr:hypothetical protein BSFA1_17710 [Burkholderia sp. SFA1]
MRIGRGGSVFVGVAGAPVAGPPDDTDEPPPVVVQAARTDETAASENARRERRGEDEFKMCSGDAAVPDDLSAKSLASRACREIGKSAHIIKQKAPGPTRCGRRV